MLRKNENITLVAISADAAQTTNLPAVGAVVSPANLEAGAIVLTDVGLARLDNAAYVALADTDRVVIVQSLGANKPLWKSGAITKGSITESIQKHLAATEQSTAIGFNGTAGTLPVANDTSYFIKIRKNDNDAANRSQPMSLFAQYKTDSTGTQEELAYGLAQVGTANFKLEPANGYLKFEVLCNDAGAAIVGAATTFDVTNGSRTVVLDGTVTNVVAGDTVRLGGTATTDPVYKVTSIDSPNTITLASSYVGDTASIAVASVQVIVAASAAVADFGVRLTGIASDFDVTSFRNYYKNRFTATFSDSSATVTHLQGAFEGVGTSERVAIDEYMSWGFEGQNEMIAIPPKAREQETISGAKYSAISLGFVEESRNTVSTSFGKGSVLVYVQLDGSDNLATSGNTGEEFATALGISAAALDA